MKILPINNNYQQNTNFKATYPVAHRIVINGKYFPVSEFDKIKKMQGKLIRALNSSFTKMLNALDKEARQNVMNWTQADDLSNVRRLLQFPKTEKEALAILRGRFGYTDLDYAYAPPPQKTKSNKTKNSEERVRTFYNREKGRLDGKYYLTYMISGKDIREFNLPKEIGKKKHDAKGINLDNAPELKEAINTAVENYNTKGLDFVNDERRRLASKTTGIKYILQTNFEPVFNKKGIIKDYKFISAKFVPEDTK